MDAIGWVSGNCRFAKPQRTKFYHASPRRFRVGDILSPRSDGAPGIFLTTDPVPHYTILEDIEASGQPWYVYEVEPLGDIVPGFWDDMIASRAKILRFVGNAQGMINRTKKKFRDKRDDEHILKSFPKFPKPPGSMVNPKEVRPHSGVKVRGRGRWNGFRWEPLPTATKPKSVGEPNPPWEPQRPEWK